MGPAATVTVPPFTEQMANRVRSVDRSALAAVPIQEIVAFLHRVGRMWKSDEYIRRRTYIRQLCQVAGFSEQMATAEADLIGAALTASNRLYDTIAVELGDRAMLDRWVVREDSEVRAFPRGLFCHVLPGNVPISALISIVRSLLTKNQTLVKVASGDPVTATSLALSFLDVDANHPVAKALHVVYWKGDDPRAARLIADCDGVCVWGGHEAVEWAHEHAAPEAELLRFGPKQSLALVDVDAGDSVDEAARRVAHDVCMYDQNACFSTRRVFVTGDTQAFVRALADALDHYSEILPPATRPVDRRAGARLARAHYEFFDSKVQAPAGESWQVAICAPELSRVHPGCRTVLVHAIDRIEQAFDLIDDTVQTVAAYPWELLAPHRDTLAELGVCRLVEAGLSGMFRLGAAHDGVYPLTRYVRLVAAEAPGSTYGKGMLMPLDMSDLLEHRQFRDLVI